MSDWMRQAAPAATILLLALARIVIGDPFAREPRPRGPEPPPVTAEALAVLNGLAVGGEVAGFEIARIAGPSDRRITIELRRGETGMRVWIMRRGAGEFAPPQRTSRFDLFYGPPPPGIEAAPEDDQRVALTAIAERIDAGAAAVPAGM